MKLCGMDIEHTGGKARAPIVVALDAPWSQHVWLCRPPVRINPHAQKAHGYSNHALAQAPPFETVAGSIAAHVGAFAAADYRFATWGGRGCDLPILAGALRAVGWEAAARLLEAAHLDLLPPFKATYPDLESHSLEAAAFHRGIPFRVGEKRHNAAEDARAAREIGEREITRVIAWDYAQRAKNGRGALPLGKT